MEIDQLTETKVIHFYKSNIPPWDRNVVLMVNKWYIPSSKAKDFGIPLSDYHSQNAVPTMHGVEPQLHTLLADMLGKNGSLSGWYVLASEVLAQFFADLGFF